MDVGSVVQDLLCSRCCLATWGRCLEGGHMHLDLEERSEPEGQNEGSAAYHWFQGYYASG